MAHLEGQTPVFYYVLQGHANILADERDKKKLLDIVLGVLSEPGVEVYAFCITNEELCLLLGGTRQAEVNKRIRRLISEFRVWCLKGSKINKTESTEEKLAVVCRRRLRTDQEVKSQMREIHMMPVIQGYVTQAKNYWWSSYQTYLGHYDWKQVNCSVILQMFSDDPAVARRQLRRYHGFLQ